MLVTRLNCLARGCSGVGPAAVRLMYEMLNLGVVPIVPADRPATE